MNRLSHNPIVPFFFAVAVSVGFQSGTALAQTGGKETSCRNTYETMRANSQSSPATAAQAGRRFLGDGCGDIFPTLAGPVQQYVKSYGQLYGTAAPATQTAAPTQARQNNGEKYNVGDRVEVDITHVDVKHGGNPAFQNWKKGTIKQVDKGTNMRYVIELDGTPDRAPYIHTLPMYQEENCLRPINGPAPVNTYECPLEEPKGPVTKDSAANDQTFKRVIFEKAKDTELHGNVVKVGMKFEVFEFGTPYYNQMTEGGLRKDSSLHLLMHDGAPPNAIIYPVKVRYSECIQHTTWKRLNVIEQNRDCFKDKFGEWTCPVGVGETKFIKQLDLP